MKELLLSVAEQITLVETLAVLTGLAYVALAARGLILCWAAALISVLLYIYICLNANLYMETALQFFYLAMAIYGWVNWQRRERQHKRTVIVWKKRWLLASAAAGAVLTIAAGYLFNKYTNASLPYLDSFTTVFALIATYMTTRKVVENWLFWIVIDAASVFLYVSKDLYLTAALFGSYVIIAFYGYIKWSKDFKAYAA